MVLGPVGSTVGTKSIFRSRKIAAPVLGKIATVVDYSLTAAVAATGTITFADNPTPDVDTITMNGVEFQFTSAASSGTGIQVKASLALTLDEVIAILNASIHASVDDATYTENGVDTLTITHDTPGTGGNAYTLAASADTVSAATLTGGQDLLALVLDSTYTLTAGSSFVAQTSNDVTATNIATAINAIRNSNNQQVYKATSSGAVVTVLYAPGFQTSTTLGITTNDTNSVTVGSVGGYTTGDAIGGINVLYGLSGGADGSTVGGQSGGSAILRSVTLSDLAKQSLAVDIVFFSSNPTATTVTDSGAIDIADADLPKVLGCVSIVAGDYIASADSSVACVRNINLPLELETGVKDLYFFLITRGSPTQAATGDFQLTFGIEEG